MEAPRLASTVVMLRDGSDGLETFIMRRSKAVGFLGGMFVFPGGKLDDTDRAVAAEARFFTGDCPAAAAQVRDDERQHREALALYVAAARETLEEAGLFPGGVVARELTPSADRIHIDGEAARSRLNESDLRVVLEEFGAHIDLNAIVPFSRWVTPAMEVRRFDTYFFLAGVAEEQEGRADGGETDRARWIRPAEAVAAHERGELPMLPPTVMTLRELADLGDADVAEAIAYAEARVHPRVQPEPVTDGSTDGFALCFPGDPSHSIKERTLPGPTRLRFVDQRWLP